MAVLSECEDRLQQHLVEFEGRTLCIASPPKISCILHTVYSILNIPLAVAAQLEQPWRITCGGRFLKSEDNAPPLGVLRVWTGGLKGGKGGFGAMLRAMAKQAGKKPTTDFGACRDLQGRRLRHVNDEIRLQKWQEDKEAESRGEKVEESKTESGIEGWHLGVPTWAEGAKPSYMKTRRKTVICQQWLDARKDRKAPDGAPPWWGCPRGRGCDFAHGKEELRGKGLEEYTRKHKAQSREMREQELDKYVKASSADEVTQDMSSAVQQGLKAVLKADIRKAAKQAEDVKGLLIDDARSGHDGAYIPSCSWMEVAGGDVDIMEDGSAEGVSEFGTARVVGVALRRRKWFYEVRLLTAGLMQIGWADHTFIPGGPDSGDGIGDVPGSWAYDGVRQQRWNDGQSDYGEAWKIGDVVGCLLEIDSSNQTANLSFTLNGYDMGTAFEGVALAAPLSTADKTFLKDDPGFYPAISLERNEVVEVNIGQKAFEYPPANGYKAIAAARGSARKSSIKHNGLHDKEVFLGNGHGEGEDAERKPIDLEQFECASGLASRYGPNRLKDELESRGVKCGGTHYQRAARLFSLKRLAPEHYPESVLAKKRSKQA